MIKILDRRTKCYEVCTKAHPLKAHSVILFLLSARQPQVVEYCNRFVHQFFRRALLLENKIVKLRKNRTSCANQVKYQPMTPYGVPFVNNNNVIVDLRY